MKNVETQLEKAFGLFDQGLLHEAEDLYTHILSLISDTESGAYYNALFGMGYVKAALGNFSEAHNIYQKLLQNAQLKRNKKEEAMYFHQLGMVERMAKNDEYAISFFNKELEIYNTYFPAYTVGYAANLYEQSYILMKQGNLNSAQEIMNQSLDYALQSKDFIAIGCSYRGLGEIYHSQTNRKLGNDYFQKAIKAFEAANDSNAVREVVTMMQNKGDDT